VLSRNFRPNDGLLTTLVVGLCKLNVHQVRWCNAFFLGAYINRSDISLPLQELNLQDIWYCVKKF
jgi:hypothetical protein